jgi:hypothetical protein
MDVIRNSKGEEVKLNAQEAAISNHWQKHLNSLGFDIQITSLTTVVKKVSEQKFFEIAPADFVPMVVGNGAWSDQLTTYRSFNLQDQFETGIMGTGDGNARMASVDAGVDSVTIPVFNWGKEIGWSIFALQMASKSGSWDLVSAKEESRKRNFDLGIQRIAFLGARGSNGANGQCLGLFNQPGITINTTLITKSIASMSYTELQALVVGLVEAYRANCGRTAWPTHFQVPESDYNGMNGFSNPEFPLKTTLEVLTDMFRSACRNKNFKLLACAYGDKAYSGLAKQQYTLYNYDEKSIVMNVPVPYTSTMANTLNGFQYQNAAYAQFTGVLVLRPLEMLYLQF